MRFHRNYARLLWVPISRTVIPNETVINVYRTTATIFKITGKSSSGDSVRFQRRHARLMWNCLFRAQSFQIKHLLFHPRLTNSICVHDKRDGFWIKLKVDPCWCSRIPANILSHYADSPVSRILILHENQFLPQIHGFHAQINWVWYILKWELIGPPVTFCDSTGIMLAWCGLVCFQSIHSKETRMISIQNHIFHMCEW